MKYILWWLAVFFSLGIFFAEYLKLYFLPLYVLFFIVIFLCVKLQHKGNLFEVAILFLSFLAGAALLAESRILPLNHISKVPCKGEILLLKGFICDPPVLINDRAIFILQAEEIQKEGKKYSCSGRVLVRAKSKGNLGYKDNLALKGKIRSGFRGNNYNQKYLARKGVYLIMYVQDYTVLNRKDKFSLLLFAGRIKDNLSRRIAKYSSPVCAALINAMVLGEKKQVPHSIVKLMVKAGTVHILVVSGFNVGIVAFLLILLLKITGASKHLRFIATLTLLILYCFITGASTPVVRATIMAIVFLFAYFVKREADIYNSCALAALLILFTNPNQLFDIGFQLSFISVLSIAFFYPKIKLWLRLGELNNRLFRYLAEGISVSLSAWLGTMGLVAYYFKLFSPVAVLANIFVVPLAALITLGGFAIAIFSLIFPKLAFYFAQATGFAAAVMVNINSFLLKLPFACIKLG